MSEQVKKTILVVEDEKPYLRALALKLEHSGFDVCTAEDGEQALKKISNSKPDLILLDLIMPGTDGFSVLTEMVNRSLSIPTIVLSNLGQPNDEKKAKNLGAIAFINKSNIQLIEVVDCVKNYMDNSQKHE